MSVRQIRESSEKTSPNASRRDSLSGVRSSVTRCLQAAQ